MEKLIIVGSGPAGATAAVYAARAGLAPVMLTGMQRGGQLTTTTEVENYPGFPEGIMGPELTEAMIKQAERFGTDVRMAEVASAELMDGGIKLATASSQLETQSLIIATGSSPRKLGLEGEQTFAGKGVSYCATCDGFFFKDKVIAVAGGGDSALEEAQFLARFGSTVYLIHRREAFRAAQAMQDKALVKANIKPLMNKIIADIQGGDRLEKLVLEDAVSGGREDLAVDGLFVAIGHVPNSQPFKAVADLDEKGYIRTDAHMHTRTAGVFACGDAVDHYFMQAVTAAGMGCMAGIEAVRYLDELEGKSYPTR